MRPNDDGSLFIYFRAPGATFPAVGGHQCCKNVGKRQLPLTGLKSESALAEGKALHAQNRNSEKSILPHKP